MRYINIAQLYESLEKSPKRLNKTFLLSKFLNTTPKEEIERVMLLVQGIIFPSYDNKHLGMSSKLIVKVLMLSAGVSESEVINSWKSLGDLGDASEKLLTKRKQKTLHTSELSIKKVFEGLQKIATLEGEGSVDMKVQKVAELLSSATPIEARYIVRTVIGDLRIGMGEGTLRDAIAWAFFTEKIGLKYSEEKNEVSFERSREEYQEVINAIQHAYDVTNDFSKTAGLATKGLEQLKSASITPGIPTKVMLFIKATDIKDGFERVGIPCAIEVKYDGFRVLIHKIENKVLVFTRRLENVSKQFPDIVKAIRENVSAKECILDAEAIGYDPKTFKHLPFQKVSRRIKRKYDIEETMKELPIELDVFDVLYYKESLLNTPFKNRRGILEKLVNTKERVIRTSKQIVTASQKEAEKFYEESLKEGFEGVMMKNLEGVYKPGARVGFGVKVKPTMETLDCAIVGAEWGEGKRSEWLASFTVAVLDGENFVEIGKVGTGVKEKEDEGLSFKELTEEIKPLITKTEGRSVAIKPGIIIEIGYEEIQKSPSYSSGYALRFPRVIRIRNDKSVEEASTINDVKKLFENQRGRNK